MEAELLGSAEKPGALFVAAPLTGRVEFNTVPG